MRSKMILGLKLMLVIGLLSVGWTFRKTTSEMQKHIAALEDSGHTWKEMLTQADEIIAHPDPRLPGFGYAQKAYAHAQLMQSKEAMVNLDKCKEVDPEYAKLTHFGETLLILSGQKHCKEAATYLEHMLTDCPDTPAGLTYAARYYAWTRFGDLRDTKRAVELAERICSLEKNRYNYLLLAEILATDGQFERAIATTKEAMALPAANPHVVASDEKKSQRMIALAQKGQYDRPVPGY